MSFSQQSIDNMSVEELTQAIRDTTRRLENYIQDEPDEAFWYCNDLIHLTNNLKERIDAVLED